MMCFLLPIREMWKNHEMLGSGIISLSRYVCVETGELAPVPTCT